MNTDKNKRIEGILSGFDGAARASAPDYFYTRLKARMEKELVPEPDRKWILRPLYAFVALLLVLTINAVVILKGNDGNNTAVESAVATDTELMQSLASDYSINSNITYDLNQ